MNVSELFISVFNTLAVSIICISVAVPTGSLLAILLVRTDIIGRRLCWIAIGSQLAVPLYAFAGSWSAGFGLQGWLNLVKWLGPGGVAAMQSSLGMLLATAFIHALAAIPWVCLIIALGLMWTDRNQEEAALLEGGWLAALTRVVLPKLRPWLLAACVWCVMPVLGEMVVTNLYQVHTVAEQVYLDASRGTISPLTYIASVALCMLPLLLLALAAWRSLPEWSDVLARAGHHRYQVQGLRRWRGWLSACVWLILGGLVGLPMVNLFLKAGWQNRVSADGLTQYGWSGRRLVTTVVESFSLHTQEFYWTTVLALASSTTALALTCLAFAGTRRRGRLWLHATMLLILAVPGPLAGMLVIHLLNREWPPFLGVLYDQTLLGAILAQQFRLLPMSWLLVNTLVAAIPGQTWELAAVDGFTPAQRFRYIIWPQCRLPFLASFLLLAVTSVGELSCTILVLPPGVTTVAMRLFEMLHFGMRHQDSGLCGVLVIVGWCVSLVFWKTLNER